MFSLGDLNRVDRRGHAHRRGGAGARGRALAAHARPSPTGRSPGAGSTRWSCRPSLRSVSMRRRRGSGCSQPTVSVQLDRHVRGVGSAGHGRRRVGERQVRRAGRQRRAASPWSAWPGDGGGVVGRPELRRERGVAGRPCRCLLIVADRASRQRRCLITPDLQLAGVGAARSYRADVRHGSCCVADRVVLELRGADAVAGQL